MSENMLSAARNVWHWGRGVFQKMPYIGMCSDNSHLLAVTYSLMNSPFFGNWSTNLQKQFSDAPIFQANHFSCFSDPHILGLLPRTHTTFSSEFHSNLSSRFSMEAYNTEISHNIILNDTWQLLNTGTAGIFTHLRRVSTNYCPNWSAPDWSISHDEWHHLPQSL